MTRASGLDSRPAGPRGLPLADKSPVHESQLFLALLVHVVREPGRPDAHLGEPDGDVLDPVAAVARLQAAAQTMQWRRQGWTDERAAW